MNEKINMTTQALVNKIIFESNCPINVRKICLSSTSQALHDLTDKKHYHDFTELVLISEGVGIHWVEGSEYNVAPGDVFLLQGNQQHYLKMHKNMTLYNVMFRPEFLQLPIKELY